MVNSVVHATAAAIKRAPDGKLVMAANDYGKVISVPTPFVARWFANGSPDMSFGQGGLKGCR